MLYNSPMPAKRNVNISASLPAETRRRAGRRASATAATAAAREVAALRGAGAEKASAQKKRERRGGVEDFIRLAEYMRESGWDGFDYKAQRQQFGRRFDDIG